MSTDQIETVHVSLPFYRHRLRQKALDAEAPRRTAHHRIGDGLVPASLIAAPVDDRLRLIRRVVARDVPVYRCEARSLSGRARSCDQAKIRWKAR